MTVAAAALGPPRLVPFHLRKAFRWQGKIAVAAKNGNGLDGFQRALNRAKQDVRWTTVFVKKQNKTSEMLPNAISW